MLTKFLNLIILLIAPFLMIGVIKKTKAFWGGRKGVSLFQPLYDFIKLLKKDLVISKTTSGVFKIAPIIIISSVFAASLFVPLAFDSALINIPAGLIIFSYVLGLGKFFALISAMDTGSSFEGMGASREACFTTIIEPAFFMVMASIMAISGNYTFDSLSLIIVNSRCVVGSSTGTLEHSTNIIINNANTANTTIKTPYVPALSKIKDRESKV